MMQLVASFAVSSDCPVATQLIVVPSNRLQEACSQALEPLPAPMSHESATIAPKTLGSSAPPFHDPFHACLLAQTAGVCVVNEIGPTAGLGESVSVTPSLPRLMTHDLAMVCRGSRAGDRFLIGVSVQDVRGSLPRLILAVGCCCHQVFRNIRRERGGVVAGERVRDLKDPVRRLSAGPGVHGVGGLLILMR
jgi:hypothetical protein